MKQMKANRNDVSDGIAQNSNSTVNKGQQLNSFFPSAKQFSMRQAPQNLEGQRAILFVLLWLISGKHDLVTVFALIPHGRSNLQYFRMVKNTQKRRTPAKQSLPLKRLSKSDCSKLVRRLFAARAEKGKARRASFDRIKELVSESTLECPICLQIFLKPVVGECGHIFCLCCAEDLAKNDYCCGICHDFQPTFELTVDRLFQQLVTIYLTKCTGEDKKHYLQRLRHHQQQQQKRRVDSLEVGTLLDYWCVQQKCWKSAQISAITEGVATMTDTKSAKPIYINIQSRRIARHRFFTKEEPPKAPHPILAGLSFGGVNGVGASILGMPMFVNMLGARQAQHFQGLTSGDYLGFLPQYRPFSF